LRFASATSRSTASVRAYVRGAFKPPKSKYGRRQVPIGHALVRKLRRATAGATDLRARLFPDAHGRPLHASNLRTRAFKPAAEEAGVPWAGFHTLRHTCATRLFGEGRNAVQVQRWLGHHSPAFTLAVYVHLLDGDLGGPLELPGGVSEVSAGPTPIDTTSGAERPAIAA
jgi:integrase